MAGTVLANDLQPGDVLIVQRRGPAGSVVDVKLPIVDVTEQGPDVRIDAEDLEQASRPDGGTAVVIRKRTYETVTIANA